MTSTPLVGTTFFGLDISQLGSQLMSVRRRLSKRLLLLEFSASGLRYAEAAPSLDGIRFSHISRVPLPEEALERGVPSDPALMASLLQQLCQEKGIPAHRAAVVLAPDIAYQRIVDLPSELTEEQARLHLRDPATSVPLPFPLAQTDFDLYPLPRQHGAALQPYLLIAVPQALIDRVIGLLSTAGFELQALELGPFCVLRFLADELIGLQNAELHLVLELLPDCSQLTVVSSSGPIQLERLSAIRDFSDPDVADELCKEALEAGTSAEELTLNDESYLPISELDLRAVVRDVKAVVTGLLARDASTVVRGLSLSGINSAHPLIKDLFEDALGCDVKLINPVLMPRVTSFGLDDLLVKPSLARLIGLGLGFLPPEQLLSCRLPDVSPSLALSTFPSSTVDASIDPQEQPATPEMDPLDVEVIQLSPPEISNDTLRHLLEKEEEEKSEVEPVAEEVVVSAEEEEWPSLGLDLGEKEEKEEEKSEVEPVAEEVVVSAEEEEWPSIKAIPGLESQESKSPSKKAQPPSKSKIANDDSSESSFLGELRFQDD